MSKSSTIIEEPLHNPHAGEILLEEFLVPLGLSQNALPRYLAAISEIVLGKGR